MMSSIYILYKKQKKELKARMNTLNKAKVMTIIKTLLLTQPNKEWTSNNIAEFINAHDFRINAEINPGVIGQLIRKERKTSTSYLNKIELERVKGNKYKYTIKE